MLQRRIYLLPGFDPRSPNHSLRMLNDQLQRQGLGLRLRLQQQSPIHRRWHLFNQEGQPQGIEVVLLQWDDLVRQLWPRHGITLLWSGFWLYARYLLSGTLLVYLRGCTRAGLTFLWPLIYCLVWGIAVALVPLALIALAWPAGVIMLISALAAAGLCWRAAAEAERRRVSWLYRSIRYTDQLARGRDGGLLQRLEQHQHLIEAIEAERPAQAIAVVGHSSGSFVALMLAARLKRSVQSDHLLSKLELLTLGQNVVQLAVLPHARSLVDDIATLASRPSLPWRDVSSKDDWLSGAGTNPLDVAGLPRPQSNYPNTLVIPLKHRKGITSTWGLLNKQFSLHFLYLHAVPQGVESGGFDFINELLTPAHALQS